MWSGFPLPAPALHYILKNLVRCGSLYPLPARLYEPCLNGLVTFRQGEACKFIDELSFNAIEEFPYERLYFPVLTARSLGRPAPL